MDRLADQIDHAAETLATVDRRLPELTPAAADFGADDTGRPGRIGRALYAGWTAVLATRAREAADASAHLSGMARSVRDNTRDYAWLPKRPYRLAVERVEGDDSGGLTAWRATVTDLATGAATVVRDLHAPGDLLRASVVWSEVFARCDDPTSAVRWTDLAVVTASGRRVPVDRVRTGYQTHQAGGCDNTNSVVDGLGALQLTNTDRHTPAGTVLILPTRS